MPPGAIRPGRGGKLGFRINDTHVQDNRGSLDVVSAQSAT